MAGTDEFVLRQFRVEEAVRKSREAWERYCSSYRMNSNEDVILLAGASTAASERVSPSLSHFLTDYGVQNVILIPPAPNDGRIEVVIRRSVLLRRWGGTDMMLTLSGLDREECLAAMANFGGGVYLASDILDMNSLMSTAEASAFFKALCKSSTPPHSLSISGNSVFDLISSTDEQRPSILQKDHSLITVEHIMMALRHNSKIRNLALFDTSPTLRFDNIRLMEGISLDRLYLHQVCVTDEFLQALLSLKDSGSVTHSLTLHYLLASNSTLLSEWKLSCSSQFLQWKLKHLFLVHESITPSELFDFMKSLQKCTDTSLLSLSLGSLTVDELRSGPISSAQLVGVIVDALHQSSLPFLHIEERGGDNFSSPAIEAQLLRNQQKRTNTGFAILEAQGKVAAAAVRMFICGEPYAGKTTMLATLSSVCGSTSLLQKVKGYFLPLLCGAQYTERTRGIEIYRITKDGIQLSLWDLAGQREFHAFHDLMFPDSSGDSGSPTIFMFLWSPVESEDEGRGGKNVRTLEDFNNSFLYWLKFIASKTRQSNILRKLIVVITRKDQVKLLDAMFTKSSIEGVAAKFKFIIEVVEVLTVDAREPYDVMPLVSCIFKTARTVLEGFQIYGVCSEVSKYILSSQQAHKSQVEGKPIISWEDFSALCKSKFRVTDPKIQKAIAYSLNESGDIIYLGSLPFLVLAPNWFCREIMGSLIYLSESTDLMPICQNGYAMQSYLEKVLENSTHSRVEGSVLVSIMEAMHLCHKVSDDKIFIPAMLFKSTINSSRQWKMFLEVDKPELQYTYVGRRLECDRKDVTFLTPGLFPVIQVVFGKAFSGEEADLEMVEDCMNICLLDMELIVECGRGKQGHVMDVMVRASDEKLRNGGSTLAYVEERIVKTLIRVCAQPVGNQGVTLVESVIRPDCLHGPVPLQVRDDQCVSVLDLQQKMRKQLEAGVESRHLQYLWKSSPGMQPSVHSFMDLLGFEVHMQVLMSYAESLQNASVSLLSHDVPLTKIRDQLPHAGLGGRQMKGNVDVASTSAAPIGQEEDEICEEMIESNSLIQLGHACKKSTSDSMSFVESCQQEEIKDASCTDERQGQIVDAMGKDMVRAIYREVRSMNARLKAMDARQQEMERKTDHMMRIIEKMRSDLLPEIRAMVEKCFNSAMESEAGRTPRFVFLSEMDVVGGAFKKRAVMASLFKGLTRVHIELFCEHMERPHRVDAQDGVCVTIVDDEKAFVVKALPYVRGFLKMLTLVAKVGAHVVAGAGSMVPDFTQVIGLMLDTPQVLDSQSRLLTNTPVSAASLEGWQEWLLSVLETQGGATAINIYDKFKLRRFRFQDTGKVAWLCDEHYPH